MEVILREEVPNLGTIGDVVKVKPGYARNYLLPRGLAIEASSRNLSELEHQKRVIADKRLREQKSAARRRRQARAVELTFTAARRRGRQALRLGHEPRHPSRARGARFRDRTPAHPARRAASRRSASTRSTIHVGPDTRATVTVKVDAVDGS